MKKTFWISALLPLLLFVVGCGPKEKFKEKSVEEIEDKGYWLHKDIRATTFWAGEGASDANGNITNVESAWDSNWDIRFGKMEDKPTCNRDADFIPVGYKGSDNVYYYALPYNDVGRLAFEYEKASSADIDRIVASNPNYRKSGTNVNTNAVSGGRKDNAEDIPWYNTKDEWIRDKESVVKGRWLRVRCVEPGKGNGEWVYAQWLDAGPYYYDDFDYVFNNEPQKNDDRLYKVGSGSGIDLSPAVMLKMGIKKSEMGSGGINTKVEWQFVDASDVPSDGPWKKHVSDNKIRWDD